MKRSLPLLVGALTALSMFAGVSWAQQRPKVKTRPGPVVTPKPKKVQASGGAVKSIDSQ